MNFRRGWVCVFLITLTTTNYADRVALSVGNHVGKDSFPPMIAGGTSPAFMSAFEK
jgi:hypothetical protein